MDHTINLFSNSIQIKKYKLTLLFIHIAVGICFGAISYYNPDTSLYKVLNISILVLTFPLGIVWYFSLGILSYMILGQPPYDINFLYYYEPFKFMGLLTVSYLQWSYYFPKLYKSSIMKGFTLSITKVAFAIILGLILIFVIFTVF